MDPNAIWPPNLSQLLPDLFVALVTGFVVGIALEVVQRRSARRSARADAVRGWNRLQLRLRKHFVDFAPVRDDSWHLTSTVERLLADTAAEPIRDWADLLGFEPIARLVRLEANLERVRSASPALARIVDQRIREFSPDPPNVLYPGAPEEDIRYLVRQRLQRLPEARYILELHAERSGVTPRQGEKWVHEVLADKAVQAAAAAYLPPLEQARTDYSALNEEFRRIDGLTTA